MYEVIIALLTIFLFCLILGVFYIIRYNNIKEVLVKVNEAEKLLEYTFQEKIELLRELKDIILNETKLDKKMFKSINDLENYKKSMFSCYTDITKCNNLINRVKDDHNKLNDVENFFDTYEKLYKLNEKLESAVTFYNVKAKELNRITTKFPDNLIARLHKINKKTYFKIKEVD